MAKSNRKKSTISMAEAMRAEKEERHRFLAFVQGQILDDITELYDSNLGKGLVSYGRITAYRDLLQRIEQITGNEIQVDFMVRIRDQ